LTSILPWKAHTKGFRRRATDRASTTRPLFYSDLLLVVALPALPPRDKLLSVFSFAFLLRHEEA
jgi:hypothetical protein